MIRSSCCRDYIHRSRLSHSASRHPLRRRVYFRQLQCLGDSYRAQAFLLHFVEKFRQDGDRLVAEFMHQDHRPGLQGQRCLFSRMPSALDSGSQSRVSALQRMDGIDNVARAAFDDFVLAQIGCPKHNRGDARRPPTLPAGSLSVPAAR